MLAALSSLCKQGSIANVTGVSHITMDVLGFAPSATGRGSRRKQAVAGQVKLGTARESQDV